MILVMTVLGVGTDLPDRDYRPTLEVWLERGGAVSVRTERSDRWVRGYVGDVAVVDTRSPLLFWEEHFPVPRYAYAREDLRTDLLRPSSSEPPREPFFFLPQGPVTEWFDLEVDGRTIEHAAWVRDDPKLKDRIIFSWQPGLLRWLEEDEEVGGHPRDPYKRVDALPSSRHVVVSLDGVVLADTASPVLLFETSLPTRYYVPREDLNFDVLTPTSNRSHCPYKGFADQYWSVTDNPEGANIAWSYSDPFPAVWRIKGMVAFYNEMVDLEIDDVAQKRPVSVFSSKAYRPGS
jgi:uncharacterized protein (DUF427 family)